MKKPWAAVAGVGLSLSVLGWVGHSTLSTCVVGVTGTDATVSVSGWQALRFCDGMIEGMGKKAYLREEPVTGHVLCEVRERGQKLVVRDDGVFMLVGRQLCGSLTEQQPKPR